MVIHFTLISIKSALKFTLYSLFLMSDPSFLISSHQCFSKRHLYLYCCFMSCYCLHIITLFAFLKDASHFCLVHPVISDIWAFFSFGSFLVVFFRFSVCFCCYCCCCSDCMQLSTSRKAVFYFTEVIKGEFGYIMKHKH